MYRIIACFFIVFVLVSHSDRLWGQRGSSTPLYSSASNEKIQIRYTDSRILIVGGSTGAIAAALQARTNDFNVIISTPYPYLGDDVIGSLRFQLEEGEVVPEGPLGDAIYGKSDENGDRKQPDLESIKRNLDRLVRDNGITVLYETPPVGIVRDTASGLILGVVFADENGRFAVVVQTILDATPTARIVNYIMGDITAIRGDFAGKSMNITFSADSENDNPFAEPPEGPDPGENDPDAKIAIYEDIEYYTIGGEPQKISREKFPFLCQSKCETSAIPYRDENGREYPVHHYRIKIGRPSSYYEGKAPFVEYMSKLEIQLAQALCTEDTLFAADEYYKIPNLRVGTVGVYEEEWTGPDSLPINVFRLKIERAARNNIYLLNSYVGLSRPLVAKMLRPVNMITVGKRVGTALSVGTQPAEQVYQTSQAITRNHLYYRINSPPPAGDNRISVGEDRIKRSAGFADITEPFERANRTACEILVIGQGENGIEAAKTAAANGAKVAFLASFGTSRSRIRELADSGVEVWFDCFPFAAVFDVPPEGSPKADYTVGVLAHTNQGQFVFRTKLLIDASKSGRIARGAGAKSSPDYNPLAFMDSPLPRKIRTEVEFSAVDFLLGKTYSDTICRFEGEFTDLRPYTIGDPGVNPIHLTCSIPLGSCIPKGVDRVFLAGEGIGGTRDAVGFMKGQGGAMKNLEAAIAYAALNALESSRPINDLTIRDVQRKIVAQNLLPETVLKKMDNSRKILESLEPAIAEFPEKPELGPLVLWNPGRSLRPLREAFEKAEDEESHLKYALALAACGDSCANDILLASLENAEWSDTVALTVRLLADLNEYRAVPVISRLLADSNTEGDFKRKRACLSAVLAIGVSAFPEPSKSSMFEKVRSMVSSRDISSGMLFTSETGIDEIWTVVSAANILYKIEPSGNQSKRVLELAVRQASAEPARFASECLKKKDIRTKANK